MIDLSTLTAAQGFIIQGDAAGDYAGYSTVTLGTRTLTTGDAGDDTFAGVISGTGRLIKQGAGILKRTSATTYSATTTVSGGTLQAGAANGP